MLTIGTFTSVGDFRFMRVDDDSYCCASGSCFEGDDAWRPVISRFGDAGDVGSRYIAVVKAVVTSAKSSS